MAFPPRTPSDIHVNLDSYYSRNTDLNLQIISLEVRDRFVVNSMRAFGNKEYFERSKVSELYMRYRGLRKTLFRDGKRITYSSLLKNPAMVEDLYRLNAIGTNLLSRIRHFYDISDMDDEYNYSIVEEKLRMEYEHMLYLVRQR